MYNMHEAERRDTQHKKGAFMNILVVGSGGREHAIVTAVAKSARADKIYCAPGNAGIASLAECVPIGAMEFEKLIAFAKEKAIDFTIVGMDDPLVGGIVDAFEAQGLKAFGPRKNAAILEGSKAFSKDLMKKYKIPTAAYENFTDPKEALAYLETAKLPIVLKADGLALGKGVLICNTLEEAKAGVKEIMEDKKFGTAGNTMVIEEFMTGREVSVLSFVDGRTIKIMSSAQDHKRALDGDKGLNTGGMGNFSPSPFYTKEVDDFCKKYIYQPTVDAMAAEGREFKGVIFFGLMLTEEGPKVLEYNARFGDPEAQVVLPRMKNDVIDVMEACVDGTLDKIDLEFEDNAAVCVVLASDGYPVSYEKGYKITGLEKFDGKENYFCFHAGTKFDDDGNIVTNGGRVLGITATGATLKEARAKAYEATEWVDFANKYMRHDIGKAIDEA
jgi:phosphoribosylamine--glycine ligase